MDLLIAILWFLNLLIPGKSYTHAEVDAIAAQNQTAVQAIKSDATASNQALSTYDHSVTIPEPWDDDLPEPIPD